MIRIYSIVLIILGILVFLYGLYIIIAKKPLITKIKQPIFRHHKNFVGKTILYVGFVFMFAGFTAIIQFDFSIFALIVMLIVVLKKRYEESKSLNSISFHNFSEYYGDHISVDEESNNKLNKICSLIQGGERDIKKIAEESSCTIEECVFKIKYLINIKKIDNFKINHYTKKLYILTPEDEKLLEKYNSFLYGSHPQIDVIAKSFAVQENKSVEEEKEIIFNELKYLDDRKLLNGITFNEVDKKLVYFDVKNKKSSNLITVHCPNCGALNDISIGDKERCIYCNTIIVGDDNDD